MPERSKVRWSQLKVGIVGLTAVLIAFVLIILITTRKGLFTHNVLLRTYMGDASGIQEGTPVRLNGIQVGYLDKLQLTNSTNPRRIVEFDMMVNEKYLADIPRDIGEVLLVHHHVEFDDAPRVGRVGQMELVKVPDLNAIQANRGAFLDTGSISHIGAEQHIMRKQAFARCDQDDEDEGDEHSGQAHNPDLELRPSDFTALRHTIPAASQTSKYKDLSQLPIDPGSPQTPGALAEAP